MMKQTKDQLRIHHLESLLTKAGICPICGQEIVHDITEPFATCGCPYTMEWTGELPTISSLRFQIYRLNYIIEHKDGEQ